MVATLPPPVATQLDPSGVSALRVQSHRQHDRDLSGVWDANVRRYRKLKWLGLVLAGLSAAFLAITNYGVGLTLKSGGAAFLINIWLFISIGMIAAGIFVQYKARGPKAGHCLKCGYNLTGNVTGVCPECGTGHSGLTINTNQHSKERDWVLSLLKCAVVLIILGMIAAVVVFFIFAYQARNC